MATDRPRVPPNITATIIIIRNAGLTLRTVMDTKDAMNMNAMMQAMDVKKDSMDTTNHHTATSISKATIRTNNVLKDKDLTNVSSEPVVCAFI
jgi:hypothetical protein